jgi:hypothetical protein
MPTVTNPVLTLTTVGSDTTIAVTYDATYTAFERQLAGLGMTFHAHIDVQGMDPAGSLTGTTIVSFDNDPQPVTVGVGSQVLSRSPTPITVTRASLQEDPTVGGVADNDEIRAKIRIHSVGLPPEFTPDVFTPQQVLLG